MRTGNIIITRNPRITAYEIAVDNGFVGTEQQWLDSLNGTVKVFVGNFTQVSGGTVTQLNATQPDALTGIVWTFGSAPNWYTGTLTGAFPDVNKVFVTSDLMADEIVYEIIGGDEIRIQSTGLPAVEGKIKIEVYP